MRTLKPLAQAIAMVLVSSHTFGQKPADHETSLPEIVVKATPFNTGEEMQILAPSKVLAGDELRNKIGHSLGDTLSHELGVSTSAFGGASRPVIRGLEGNRVKILQNGMSVSDVSSVSNDHAVAAESSTAKQIEILRGPAALLYGSGAIGGLVNVVNERIPTTLEPTTTGELEGRYGTVNTEKSISLSLDGSTGPVGLHIDSNIRHAKDYSIPGLKILNDSTSASGTLPLSYTRENSVGVGASYIADWGHMGVSAGTLNNRYGIPTQEGAQIDQTQHRYDLETLIKKPFSGLDKFKFKLAYTDYKHTELDLSDTPETHFLNKSLETRAELTHAPIGGWHGTFGLQTEDSRFSAVSAETGGTNTVPMTKSTSFAGFLVEEREFGPIRFNAGLRVESVKREPVAGQKRSFDLQSYSVGGLWRFIPGYGLGATVSIAQRAPSTEELYSNGAHEATGTFDKGNEGFEKERSQNIELSLQKTKGLIRWKTNIFQNRIKNFVFGTITGNTLDDDGNAGGELNERVFSQVDATIRGAEAEISYNQRGEGFSTRGFTDTSRGVLNNAGNLPLQPSTRVGINVGYKQGSWRTSASVLHALKQNRLAAFETATSSYTQLDANVSYTQRYGNAQITWFALARNLLNQDVRLSTSVIKDVAPLPGRALIVGIRTRF